MKKKFLIICLILSLTALGVTVPKPRQAKAENTKPRLAIVIDDFGEDRRGVEEMLSLKIPLTVAVMPMCEYSKDDAEKAHQKGHEVILHMPMQNASYSTPASFYGPVYIKNEFSEDEAVNTLRESLGSVPHAVGMNIHMGTGVSRNKNLITAMMNEMKSKNMLFLDSKTTEETVCPQCADSTNVKFFSRDVFLEPPGRPNYALAKQQLLKAGRIAKEKGSAIAIGHVGPVGTTETARAILDSLPELDSMGVEIVPLSQL